MELTILEDSFDNLPYGIYIVDHTGKYIYANSTYINMVKIPKEKLLGYNVYSFKKNKEINICVTEKVCQSKKRVRMFQDVEIKGLEHYKQIIDSNPILDANGNVKFIIALCIPIEQLNSLYQETNSDIHSFIQLPYLELNNSIEIIAESFSMKNILNIASTIAKLDTSVLISGESGTGKEILAKFIHEKSNRSSKEMIIINCASLPENLLESELFGYEKGAFTGASSSGKKGLFELADKSTLFLDEINSLPFSLQGKILRAIETKTIRRIGSTINRNVDFRLIVATNEDLLKLVQEKKFRQDLYYRLNIIPLTLPPLRERKEDILPLIEYFRKYYCNIYNKNKSFSPKTFKTLAEYYWPGNIRELKNFVERSLIMFNSEIIEVNNISSLNFTEIKEETSFITFEKNIIKTFEKQDLSLDDYIAECEKNYLKYAIEKYKSSYKVAKFLKSSQTTIIRKKKKYNL